MSAPYYADHLVTLWHGEAEDVLPTIESTDHFIADPPYSEHVHGAERSRIMRANDRGGRYGADFRRNVELGFTHLTPELRDFLAAEAARLTKRWVLIFSDVEGAHEWADATELHGLDYVRTGAWIKRGSTPQFSGDPPRDWFRGDHDRAPEGGSGKAFGRRLAVRLIPVPPDLVPITATEAFDFGAAS